MCAETFAQGPKGYLLNVGKGPARKLKKRERNCLLPCVDRQSSATFSV